MVTPTPTSVLGNLLESLRLPSPPPWLVDEVQQRLVLLLNHVLMQEPQAQDRLKRQAGRVVLAQWRDMHIRLEATPAGLLGRAKPTARADLTLTVAQSSPLTLAQDLLGGQRPAVTIEGDVQLAAEVNWLVEHVRWDLEEDLSRVLGDTPAHWLSEAARTLAAAIRSFVTTISPGKGQP